MTPTARGVATNSPPAVNTDSSQASPTGASAETRHFGAPRWYEPVPGAPRWAARISSALSPILDHGPSDRVFLRGDANFQVTVPVGGWAACQKRRSGVRIPLSSTKPWIEPCPSSCDGRFARAVAERPRPVTTYGWHPRPDDGARRRVPVHADPRARRHACPAPEADATRIAEALVATHTESTLACYADAWKRWATWCAGRGLVALPAAVWVAPLSRGPPRACRPGTRAGPQPNRGPGLGSAFVQESATAAVATARKRRGRPPPPPPATLAQRPPRALR